MPFQSSTNPIYKFVTRVTLLLKTILRSLLEAIP